MRSLGFGAITGLAGEVRRLAKGDKILVVTGTASAQHPAIVTALNELRRLYSCKHYAVTAWLATAEEYAAFEAEHRESAPDCIVAIGGGRVMDFAKIAATGLDAQSLQDNAQNGAPIVRKIPLIAIPTTAGSGAEATPFAVFYFGSNKISITHPSLLPDSDIVDPTLLSSLSKHQMAVSGADAVCQGIESIFSPASTSASIQLGQHAATLGLAALPAYLESAQPEFAEMQCLASNLSGQAITIARTNIPHALSYHLTYHYNVSHGQAVSFYIGSYLDDVLAKVEQSNDISEAVKSAAYAIKNALGVTATRSASQAWGEWLERIGLQRAFRTPDPETLRKDILASANIERLKNLVVEPDIHGIVERAIVAE